MQRRQRDLGRAHQIQVIPFYRIDASPRPSGRSLCRTSPPRGRAPGWKHGHETLLPEPVEREADRARARAAPTSPDPVDEARARDRAPHAPCRSSRTPAPGRRDRCAAKSNEGGSPTRRELHCVLLGRARPARIRSGGLGTRSSSSSRRRFGLGELLLEPLELGLHLLQLLELLRASACPSASSGARSCVDSRDRARASAASAASSSSKSAAACSPLRTSAHRGMRPGLARAALRSITKESRAGSSDLSSERRWPLPALAAGVLRHVRGDVRRSSCSESVSSNAGMTPRPVGHPVDDVLDARLRTRRG